MKPRNYVAKDMYSNGLYRAKVVESKKAYKRKNKHKEEYDYDTRKSTYTRHENQNASCSS